MQFAKEFCQGLPVNIVHSDYRNVQGKFDKVVSVGMFEHVGRKNYRTFMQVVHRCLKEDGVFLLHTIGSNESQLKSDPLDNKIHFPQRFLPSIAQISKSVKVCSWSKICIISALTMTRHSWRGMKDFKPPGPS